MATPPLRRTWPVTFPALPWAGLLWVATVAGFIVVTAVPGALRQLALVPGELASRPWTALSYPFVHLTPLPLLLDFAALVLLAPRLEGRAGGARMVAWFMAGTIAGALLAMLRPGEQLVGSAPAILGLLVGVARTAPVEIDGESTGTGWRWLAVVVAVVALLPQISGAPLGLVRGALIGSLVASLLVRSAAATRKMERRVEEPNSHFNPPGVQHEVKMTTPWDSIDLDALHEVNRGVIEVLLRRARELGPTHLSPGDRELLDRMASAHRLAAEQRRAG